MDKYKSQLIIQHPILFKYFLLSSKIAIYFLKVRLFKNWGERYLQYQCKLFFSQRVSPKRVKQIWKMYKSVKTEELHLKSLSMSFAILAYRCKKFSRAQEFLHSVQSEDVHVKILKLLIAFEQKKWTKVLAYMDEIEKKDPDLNSYYLLKEQLLRELSLANNWTLEEALFLYKHGFISSKLTQRIQQYLQHPHWARKAIKILGTWPSSKRLDPAFREFCLLALNTVVLGKFLSHIQNCNQKGPLKKLLSSLEYSNFDILSATQIFTLKAMLYEKMGHIQKAIDSYESSLAFELSAATLNSLSSLYLLVGQKDTAKYYLKKLEDFFSYKISCQSRESRLYQLTII